MGMRLMNSLSQPFIGLLRHRGKSNFLIIAESNGKHCKKDSFLGLYRHFSSNPQTSRMDQNQNKNGNEILHKPVMVDKVIELLQPENDKTYIDMTFGAGGHTKAILERAPLCSVLALDRDPLAHGLACKLQEEFSNVQPLLGKFSDLPQLLKAKGIKTNSIDGVLMDVGVSSMQFDTAVRGFAISKDGPLDMRMDGNRLPEQPSAADVVNHLDASSLTQILKKYGEEKQAKSIAHAIVEARYSYGKIKTTKGLADIVSTVFQGAHIQDKLGRPVHSATKTFQALRIFVNNELNELSYGIKVAHAYLKPQGRCIAISFHSLEDRIVKRHFHGIDMELDINQSLTDHISKAKSNSPNILQPKDWTPLSKKVFVPTDEECSNNKRSRSAKLRAAVKN